MSTSVPGPFSIGDRVIFTSIHGDFPINGKTAKIIETEEMKVERILVQHKDETLFEISFPDKISYCIQFDDDFGMTWCRKDEIVKI